MIGAGGVGLAAVTLARSLLPCRVVVADVSADKRAAALAAGATAAFDPAERGDALAGEAPPLGVLDFVGSPRSLRLALDGVATGGTIVVVGLFGGEFALSVPLLPMRQITLRGSYVGSLEELRALVAHLQRTALQTIPVSRRAMSDVNRVLREVEAGHVLGRCVLIP